jgi:hypothetical protein
LNQDDWSCKWAVGREGLGLGVDGVQSGDGIERKGNDRLVFTTSYSLELDFDLFNV